MIKPEKVMEKMEQISYGWLDIYDKKHINTIENLTELYRVSSPSEVLENKIGICFDQVELERKLFELDYETKSYAIYTNHMAHSFLILYKKESYIYFEHSSSKSKGIYYFSTEEEAVADATKKFKETHRIRENRKVEVVPYPPLEQGTTFSEIKDIISNKQTKKEGNSI